ncbi:tRNA threonylcarbamoyladenosine biosynthesis protein TsaE [Rubricella aquisinus]|uniref:tRNA threonylcarbamoyladenosine biosynthesis protein TsaE n=1 Tax=Rubricella aquisinus TaxID=2028108 RepID=A0A840WK40_9RHOB|nr:tRNA (adenosine(37)-N6)-threonylcarbamoyltransferase complex ATPase subunit type 1 TsaE [Rubricella aquisinus]MBB5514042.1 tRNA threonylcarbamoyladenosine biosynthesis protein TsaE [Rubricella aquisinus]
MQDQTPLSPDQAALITLSLPDEAATTALAQAAAGVASTGDVILLDGPVGAGKSHFARAFIRAVTSPTEEVPSPTFTLVQVYESTCEIWHLDLYRVADLSELEELGLMDAMSEAICLIEWPGRLGPLTPSRAMHVALTPVQDATGESRIARIHLTGGGWERMAATLTSHESQPE